MIDEPPCTENLLIIMQLTLKYPNLHTIRNLPMVSAALVRVDEPPCTENLLITMQLTPPQRTEIQQLCAFPN